jgi:hypothetical protein
MKGKIIGFVTMFVGLIMGFIFIKNWDNSPGMMEIVITSSAATVFAGIFITFVMTPAEREKVFG